MTRTEAARALAEAVRRASNSMQILIAELTDPGTEALAAKYELSRALAAYDAAPEDDVANAERARIAAVLRSPDALALAMKTGCDCSFACCDWPACRVDPDLLCGEIADENTAILAALAELIASTPTEPAP